MSLANVQQSDCLADHPAGRKFLAAMHGRPFYGDAADSSSSFSSASSPTSPQMALASIEDDPRIDAIAEQTLIEFLNTDYEHTYQGTDKYADVLKSRLSAITSQFSEAEFLAFEKAFVKKVLQRSHSSVSSLPSVKEVDASNFSDEQIDQIERTLKICDEYNVILMITGTFCRGRGKYAKMIADHIDHDLSGIVYELRMLPNDYVQYDGRKPEKKIKNCMGVFESRFARANLFFQLGSCYKRIPS